MKFWLVTCNGYGYDEYDSFVIRADTSDRAKQLAEEEQKEVGGKSQNWTIVELTISGEEEIILGSFNAG